MNILDTTSDENDHSSSHLTKHLFQHYLRETQQAKYDIFIQGRATI